MISPKKELIYDIDASDAHNELAVVDYVEDIYRFYRSTEVSLASSSFMLMPNQLVIER